MYKDDLILGDLYLESTQASNLNEDQQKKLASFIVKLVVKSDAGDQEALRILSMSPDEIAGMMSQGETVQTEAFENIRSKVGGFLGGTGSIQKRYEFLKKSLSKILWELGEDIKTTRSEEAIGKYNTLTNTLKNIDPTLTPEGGTFQKAAYSVGKGVGTVGKVIAGGLLAKSLLTIGLPAMAVGGIMGGVLSVLKNAQNTKITPAEKIKKALSAAGLGVMIGFAMGELRELIGGDGSSATGSEGSAASYTTSTFFADEELLKSAIEDYAKDRNYNISDIRIEGGYIKMTSPSGEDNINLNQLKKLVNDIRISNRPPGNSLAGYISDAIDFENTKASEQTEFNNLMQDIEQGEAEDQRVRSTIQDTSRRMDDALNNYRNRITQ